MPDFSKLPKASVVKRIDLLAKDHFLVWIKPAGDYSFIPGQYITIGKDETLRPYSIVSAPHEKSLELFVETVPEELRTEKSLTPKLHALLENDEVVMMPKAKGKFILDENSDVHVMVSTVTGIAPFVSMVRAYLHGYYKKEFSKPFYIFQGASYMNELGYYDELSHATQTGKVVYVPTVSRPDDPRNSHWKGQTGRVNVLLENQLKKYGIEPNEKTTIYLCGNRGMIEHLGNKREKEGKPLGTLVKAGFKVIEEVFYG